MADDFGLRLKALREQRGISQKELGEKINKNANTVWRYEKNLQQPTLDVLLTFSAIFRVPLSYWENGNRTDGLTSKQREIIHNLQNDFLRLDKMSKEERAIRMVEITAAIMKEFFDQSYG